MGKVISKLVFHNKMENVSTKATSIKELSARNIDGELIEPLEKILEGKKAILVVNVATNWGLTKTNYTELVQIYKEHQENGLEILAFPCNQFRQQEPGTNEEIKAYAQNTYGVTFPMFEKIDVNGDNAHEVYRFLRRNSPLHDEAKKQTGSIPWNFAKFLLDSDGHVVNYYAPPTSPTSILPDIERLLWGVHLS
jgi:glutathione peroxidase